MSRSNFLFLTIFMIFSFSGCKQETSTPDENTHVSYEGTIIAMGDSLTEGYGLSEEDAYPAKLQELLNQRNYRYRVINAGVSGETSSGALSRVDWILSMNPDIVILETGANDGLRGLDTGALKGNLDRIVERLTGSGVVVVLAGMKIVSNLGKDYSESFAGIFPETAKRHGIVLVPFFLEGVGGNPFLNQVDGIHPNKKGYEIITRMICPYVIEAIKQSREKKG